MTDYFLLMIYALLVVPGNFENYDVLIIPVLDANRKKSVEVFMLPRKLMLLKHHHPSQFDVKDFKEPNESLYVDYFKSSQDKADIPTSNIGRALSDGKQEDEYNDDDTDNRIVRGLEVDMHMYPYQVAYGEHCGGALIGSKWVLTAAHCSNGAYIRIGSKYRNEGKKIMIRTHHFHPKWGEKKKEHFFDYDFQVLELKEDVWYDEYMQPVKIGRIEDMVIGKELTVSGWGAMENGSSSNVLRAVNVPIISEEICQQVPFPHFNGGLTSRMFCAGYIDGTKDACYGDSGGPAVSNDRLLGVISFGYGCATPGAYGVYGKVAEVRNWIQRITGLDLK